MDPVTMASVVSTVVSGAAGEVGAKLWDGLAALVRRPFHGDDQETGAAELAAVEQARHDEDRVLALTRALVARADAEETFAAGLEAWLRQARRVTVDIGGVSNTISGGRQTGPVIQGRDFHGLTFSAGTTPPRSSPDPTGDHG